VPQIQAIAWQSSWKTSIPLEAKAYLLVVNTVVPFG
jgi:hypothetical protein